MRIACALVGVLLLGSACISDDAPSAHLGGREAPSFAELKDLIVAADTAGVPCAEPERFDAYADLATDQVYPPTEAARCENDRDSTVFFLYATADDRIEAYEQAVIQEASCDGLSDEQKRTSHSVAGANWRVTSVGTDHALRLIDYFDGQAVEEPMDCFPKM